jgi:hypothetical protein
VILRGDHCQCADCLEYFNSTAAFDKHRTGGHGVDRRCRTATEMLLAGMVKNAGGWWLTAQNPRVYPSCNSVGGDLPGDIAA